MSFEEDLKTGHKAEEYILNELKGFDPTVKRVEGYEKRFDIVGDEATYEVKYDITSKETGNVAIEYMCNGKPSGISTTKADYWVYVYYLDDWVWQMMYVEEFKLDLKLGDFKRTNGGDNNASKLLIIPINAFAKLAYTFPKEITKNT